MKKVQGSDLARAVVAGLLHLDAKQRLPVAEVCSHQWIQEWRDEDRAEPTTKRRRTSNTAAQASPQPSLGGSTPDRVPENIMSPGSIDTIIEGGASAISPTRKSKPNEKGTEASDAPAP